MKNTVRLTFDIPEEQHTYIKLLATKEGRSLKEYIIDHLPSPHKDGEIPREKFDLLLDEIIEEYKDELKSLSKR